MGTRIVMTTSALLLASTGIILSFIPEEILIYFGLEVTKLLQVLIQVLGALYFAFGMLNWMTKNSLIGGIYNRPITVANFTHFLVAGLALVKGLVSASGESFILWTIAGIYLVFALAFGVFLFRHPLPDNQSV